MVRKLADKCTGLTFQPRHILSITYTSYTIQTKDVTDAILKMRKENIEEKLALVQEKKETIIQEKALKTKEVKEK